MHHIWVWEQYLEAEESRTRTTFLPDGRNQRSVEGGQAAPGEDNTLPRDLFPLSREPDDVEESENHSSEEESEGSHTESNSLRRTRTFKEEDLLPCHYFDFMYGTSTGGLIATILGRLRMTVDEGLELYRSVGDDLFGKRRSHIPLTTKYYHQPLEKAVQKVVQTRCHEHQHCDGNDFHPWDADTPSNALAPYNVDMPRVCQSCCLTATHDKKHFRSVPPPFIPTLLRRKWAQLDDSLQPGRR